MAFDYSDLEPNEVAGLALAYLKTSAHWLEQASDGCSEGEVARVLAEISAETHSFADELDASIAEHFGGRTRDAEVPSERLNRSPDLVDGEIADLDSQELLEAATAEQEESYQFFMQEANEIEDPWVRDMFEKLAEFSRGVVVLLEEERERVQDEDV